MKQFVLFFISLFLLGVGARSKEMYQKKVFISSRGDSLNYRLLRPEVEKTGLQYPLVLLSYRHLRRNKGRGTGGIRPIVFFGTLWYKDKCRILLPVHRIEKHLTTMCQLLLVITPPLTGTVQ